MDVSNVLRLDTQAATSACVNSELAVCVHVMVEGNSGSVPTCILLLLLHSTTALCIPLACFHYCAALA
jgi:hypothetical protein